MSASSTHVTAPCHVSPSRVGGVHLGQALLPWVEGLTEKVGHLGKKVEKSACIWSKVE